MSEHNLTLLDTILEPGSLVPVYQPIFELKGSNQTLHSLEALMRGPKGTSVERADILFSYVRRKRGEMEVDRACVKTAIQGAALLPGELRISFNVHATTLWRDTGFVLYVKNLAESCGIAPRRLTIELIEHAPHWNATGIWRAIDEMRRFGMKLAVDDVGAGQSNYNMILDCSPDAIKIDGYVVRGCHQDPHRVAVLESITTLGRRFGTQIVAEGVEEVADLETLQRLGIDFVQGFILAKPMTVEGILESGLLWRSAPARMPEAAEASLPLITQLARCPE